MDQAPFQRENFTSRLDSIARMKLKIDYKNTLN